MSPFVSFAGLVNHITSQKTASRDPNKSPVVLLAHPLEYLTLPSQLLLCVVQDCQFLQVVFEAAGISGCSCQTSHNSLIFQVLLLRNAAVGLEGILPLPQGALWDLLIVGQFDPCGIEMLSGTLR